MKPKVISVITVTFNALPALKLTAQSVLNQTYHNIKYIIVDGASTDGTIVWLKELETCLALRSPQIVLNWKSEPDKGIYDAMNKGAAVARGEYCIFMNAGDTFADEDVVKRVVDSAPEEACVIYGDILKKGKVKHSLQPCNCHKMFYCHQAAFTLTQCLRDFPFDIKHRWSATLSDRGAGQRTPSNSL